MAGPPEEHQRTDFVAQGGQEITQAAKEAGQGFADCQGNAWLASEACLQLPDWLGEGGDSVGIQGDGGKQMVRCIQESRYPDVFRKQVFQTQLNFVLQYLFQTELNFVPRHLFQTELNLVS